MLVALIVLIILIILYAVLGVFIHKLIFKHRFSLDPLVKTYTKEDLNLEYKEISFKVDNDNINGYLFNKGNFNNKILIIVCHGMFSSHKSYMQDVGYLCNQGYQVLTFDYTGTDISEGEELVGFGQNLKCLDKALEYVKQDSELSKRTIYIYGHSWGGYATTNIVEKHRDITGIIALAPAISFSAVLKGMMPKLLWPAIPFTLLVDRIKTGCYANKSALKSLKDYKGKVLILHSVNDSLAKYKYTTEVIKKKLNNPNIKYYITDNKGHNPNYSVNAISLLNDYMNKLKTLPKEKHDEYKKNVDFLAMGELDIEVMERIIKEIE